MYICVCVYFMHAFDASSGGHYWTQDAGLVG